MSDERILAIDSTSPFMPAVYTLRHEVFVIEQQVPVELERDEYDQTATHLVALRGGDVIGTLRIVLSGNRAKVGRMAVRGAERGKGCGSRLMQQAAVVASQMGAREIVLHAQLTAKDFYRRLGYREEGDVFEEAGIRHAAMKKAIG
jgi:predicted GNAT family N-acyltransferase